MRAWRTYIHRDHILRITMAHLSLQFQTLFILVTIHFARWEWEFTIISALKSKQIFVSIEVFLTNGHDFVKEYNINTTIQNYKKKQRGNDWQAERIIMNIYSGDRSLNLPCIKFHSKCFPFVSSFNPYNSPKKQYSYPYFIDETETQRLYECCSECHNQYTVELKFRPECLTVDPPSFSFSATWLI